MGRRRTKECETQPNASPPVAVVHIQRSVVFISNRDGTIAAKRGIYRVIQVPANVLNEVACPTGTCLVQGWIEDGELFRVASDFETAVERWVVRFRSKFDEWKKRTYCSSAVSIELVIRTQGFNWYNQDRNQP